jgi:hypothetical protein
MLFGLHLIVVLMLYINIHVERHDREHVSDSGEREAGMQRTCVRSGLIKGLAWNFTWNFVLFYTLNIRNACSFHKILAKFP